MNRQTIVALVKKALPAPIHDKLVLRRRAHHDELRKNRCWKDIGVGRRAWVLATGPSIASQNLELLAGEDCYSISNFFLHTNIDLLKPKAHFFAPYHLPLVRSNYIEWLAKANDALPSTTPVILGLSDYEMIEDSLIFKERERFYLEFGAKRFGEIDCTRLIPNIQTGPHIAVNLLIYAGYDEIYLLGCDHDTLRNYGHVVDNFYSIEHDTRVNATSGLGWLPIIEHMKTQVRVFEIYQKLQTFNPNSRLINCSPTSWLRFSDIETKAFEDIITPINHSHAKNNVDATAAEAQKCQS